ncbi:hypothetical protein [Bradyrhizobium valentinum]|nr:hypothetical protein [Bradyrhizobium valentinum]
MPVHVLRNCYIEGTGFVAHCEDRAEFADLTTEFAVNVLTSIFFLALIMVDRM